MPRTRPRWLAFAMKGSSTAAIARARRSRSGRTTTGVAGTDRAAPEAVASVDSMGRSCAPGSAAARNVGWIDSSALLGRGRERRRHAPHRPRRELDIRIRCRRGRPAPGRGPRHPRPRPAERDGRADPPGRHARPRDTGRLRAPPADPATGRAKAVEGGWVHLRARPAGRPGRTAAELIGMAAAAVGLIDAPRPIPATEVASLFDR